MTRSVNHEIIVVARESRGLTQSALGSAAGISQPNLSKSEGGLRAIKPDELERIAKALHYPVDLFLRSGPRPSLGTEGYHHRKRQSLSITDQRRIHAQLTLRIQELEVLLRGVEISTPQGFASLDPDDFDGDVERIAGVVRDRWGIRSGPIGDLTSYIESNGGMVIPTEFKTTKLDAVSKLAAPLPALFFINRDMPADRTRHNLAHEIGHLVMHSGPAADVESEADRFAAEFLMPKRDILDDLCPPLNFSKLRVLKSKWRVSMQSLMYRARTLQTISERTHRSLCMQVNKRGWKRHEPEPIAPETPTLLREIMALYRDESGYSVEDLSLKSGLLADEFSRVYFPGEGHLRLIS